MSPKETAAFIDAMAESVAGQMIDTLSGLLSKVWGYEGVKWDENSPNHVLAVMIYGLMREARKAGMNFDVALEVAREMDEYQASRLVH